MQSETFATQGAVGHAVHPGGSGKPGSTERLSVAYDAATGSYTISGPATLPVFSPADAVPASESERFSAYARTSGNVRDLLLLSKPGDAGFLNYRYVGAGLWRRTQAAGGIESSDFAAFAYGITTPDSQIPLSGTASFTADLTGLQDTAFGLLPFNGSGVVSFDFGAGRWAALGATAARLPGVGEFGLLFYGAFDGDGLVASGSNSFIGGMRIDSAGRYSGALMGGFYGPGALEIGASFTGSDAQGRQLAGALVGRRGDRPSEFETLANLFAPTHLQQYYTSVSYARNANGTHSGAQLRGQAQTGISIDSKAGTIDFGFATTSAANRVDAESDTRFTTYRITGGAVTRSYRVFNLTGNDQLALTYTSLALEAYVSGSPRVDSAIIFGVPTYHVALPRTGTGVYNGVLYGTAIGSGDGADRYVLSGTASLSFEWAGNTFTGDLRPVAANERTGASFALGSYSILGGSFAGTAGMSNTFAGDIGGVAGSTGRLNGSFFGPAAQEIGGTFTLTTPGAGTVLIGSGAIVAKR